MIIFMGNSEPSQRFIFGLKLVKFTFLKGREAKSNAVWAVSFSTCMEQAWMCIKGHSTFHPVHLHDTNSWKLPSDNLGYVVHSHFALSSWMFPTCCLCSPPSFNLLFLPATIFSPVPCTPSHGGSFHSTSSSVIHVFYFCFCAAILGESCFFCPALCGHSCMSSDGVEQTFPRKVLLCSTSCSGGDKGVYPKCKLRPGVPQEGTWLMQDTTLKHIISALKQFSEIW